MNGWPYARTTWEEPDDTFAADVKIDVQQTGTGSWNAHVRIWFENPHVRVTDPGKPKIDGHLIKINATAIVSATADVQPRPYEFNYDLGALRPGGYRLTTSSTATSRSSMTSSCRRRARSRPTSMSRWTPASNR